MKWILTLFLLTSLAIQSQKLPKGFSYIKDVSPTIQGELRYCHNNNFMGVPVNGYEENILIVTTPTAKALKKVQDELATKKLGLKIYDAYRNSYKDQILGMIDERGIERSTMHILQGLTRLRQICDSPAILKDEEQFPNHSIKLDELIREITENVGNHKALVFSQFLGMLALIRKKLEELKAFAHQKFEKKKEEITHV